MNNTKQQVRKCKSSSYHHSIISPSHAQLITVSPATIAPSIPLSNCMIVTCSCLVWMYYYLFSDLNRVVLKSNGESFVLVYTLIHTYNPQGVEQETAYYMQVQENLMSVTMYSYMSTSTMRFLNSLIIQNTFII